MSSQEQGEAACLVLSSFKSILYQQNDAMQKD